MSHESAGVEFTNGDQPGVRSRLHAGERGAEMARTYTAGDRTFRVGDRVRARDNVPAAGLHAGAMGTVVDSGVPRSPAEVPVRFDHEVGYTFISGGIFE